MPRRNAVLRPIPPVVWAGLAAAAVTACSDLDPAPIAGPPQPAFGAAAAQPGIERAIEAQQRHGPALLRVPGVVGTAVGLLPDGRAAVRIFLTSPDVTLPAALDGVPVAPQVTGLFVARSDPRTRQRPAPLGFSVGHPAITAGTIGVRVLDGAGLVYILSNNHVLANTNDAAIGDPILQPGPFDGGTLAADQVATLSAFQAISFASNGQNTMDAAIARTTAGEVGAATPTDDGYGAPSTSIYGDANGDGMFDNRNALLGVSVKKYGRTTKLTTGQITGINASLSICYEVFIFICLRSANFQDQLIIEPGSFSGGGDSGSLIVSSSGNQPIGLLFAGSTAQTIANRIDLVLSRFGVRVDNGAGPPPTPVTDLAITGVSAPASVTQGATVDVVVTVRNLGTVNITSSFDVTLRDLTDNAVIGTQSVNGLAAGATATRTFAWNTSASSTGTHTLEGRHAVSDDNAANNALTTTSTVNAPGTGDGIHVGDLDAITSNDGKTWSATVEVLVHDAAHNPVQGAVVVGVWDPAGLASDTCTTGELGGNGTCIFLYPGIRKKTSSVTFTVTSVTMGGKTYQATANHDPDGSSNGTVIVVIKP